MDVPLPLFFVHLLRQVQQETIGPCRMDAGRRALRLRLSGQRDRPFAIRALEGCRTLGCDTGVHSCSGFSSSMPVSSFRGTLSTIAAHSGFLQTLMPATVMVAGFESVTSD